MHRGGSPSPDTSHRTTHLRRRTVWSTFSTETGHVAYVTFNRPAVRNALHSNAYAELRSCWRDISLDPDIYVGIVTGAGQAFCAGRDVKFLAQYQAQGKRTPHEDPNNPLFHWGGGGQPQDVNLEKPLIAAALTVLLPSLRFTQFSLPRRHHACSLGRKPLGKPGNIRYYRLIRQGESSATERRGKS